MGFGERDYVKEKARQERARQERAEELKRRSHNSRPSGNWGNRTNPKAAKWLWIRIFWWALVFAVVYWYKHYTFEGSGVEINPPTELMGGGGAKRVDIVRQKLPFDGFAKIVGEQVIPKKIAAIPLKTGYTDLNGQVVMDGNASFTIANKAGSTMFGKLFHIDKGRLIRVREFYILVNDSITLNRLDNGYYILKYKALEPDINYKTDPMEVGAVGKFVFRGTVITVGSELDSLDKISDGEFNSNQ